MGFIGVFATGLLAALVLDGVKSYITLRVMGMDNSQIAGLCKIAAINVKNRLKS